MVFTLEPRLKVPDRGVATIEEMIIIKKDGAEFLSKPQKKLILIKWGGFLQNVVVSCAGNF